MVRTGSARWLFLPLRGGGRPNICGSPERRISGLLARDTASTEKTERLCPADRWVPSTGDFDLREYLGVAYRASANPRIWSEILSDVVQKCVHCGSTKAVSRCIRCESREQARVKRR